MYICLYAQLGQGVVIQLTSRSYQRGGAHSRAANSSPASTCPYNHSGHITDSVPSTRGIFDAPSFDPPPGFPASPSSTCSIPLFCPCAPDPISPGGPSTASRASEKAAACRSRLLYARERMLKSFSLKPTRWRPRSCTVAVPSAYRSARSGMYVFAFAFWVFVST